LSDRWGYDRGQPIDRFYIDGFLAQHCDDIRGDVLEVKEPLYVDRYGRNVSRCEVLDIDPGNELATIVADLAQTDSLPPESFDCIVLTQTLQYVADVPAAVHNGCSALRAGGVLLATVPGVNRADEDPQTPSLWSFTEAGCTQLFEREFGSGNISVHSYGNVLSAIAFLSGMAREELSAEELDVHDMRFPVIVAVRAVRP
jgi:SAM-dependent methyltransferase